MINLTNSKPVIKIRQKFEEDPLAVTVVGSIAVTAVAKLIDSLSAARGRRAYARDVDRRVRQSRR